MMPRELRMLTRILSQSSMNWANTRPGGGNRDSLRRSNLAVASVHSVRKANRKPMMPRNRFNPCGFRISADTSSTRTSAPTANQMTKAVFGSFETRSGRNCTASRTIKSRFAARRNLFRSSITAPPRFRRFSRRCRGRRETAARSGTRCNPSSAQATRDPAAGKTEPGSPGISARDWRTS